jgi:hypothetical protein
MQTMRTSTRVLILLAVMWVVAGAIMNLYITPAMAQAFKLRYKVDPYQVHKIVGVCTAGVGGMIFAQPPPVPK